MNFNRFISIVFLAGFVSFFSCNQQSGTTPGKSMGKSPVDYVNPYIGNISHMLVATSPVVHLPNSMVRMSPSRSDYTGDILAGLPLAQRRMGSFALCPMTDKTMQMQVKPAYYYDLEKVTPYRYFVFLTDVDVQVDFAPSHQSALYKLNYGQDGDKYLALKINSGELKEENGAISGYETIANGIKVYVYMDFSQKPENVEISEKSALMTFNKSVGSVTARYGISFIDAAQAQKNIQREIKDFDVDKLAATGREVWNEALGKIQIEGGTENEKTVFYTSLYRTYIRMIKLSEDDRYFSAFDKQVHNDDGSAFYTDDGIWDTYLAAHPLGVLINPKVEADKVNSYIRMYEQSGWIPTFPGTTGDNHVMNGNHAVAIIWDAYIKGLRGFNLETAFEGCKKSIMEETMIPWRKAPLTELDLFFQKNGYFPALHPGEPETCPVVNPGEMRQTVAVTQAASFDDWCLAQIAKELGKTDDYAFFSKRSYNYRNLFNPATGFFHPKDKNGKFIEPFDYIFSGGQGARDYYDENNGWTYRWGVQHNIADLISLMGGTEKFIAGLDEMFITPLGTSRWVFYRQLPDQTGNVGQFSMANEPSFHIPYLYNYVGQPWKTQKRVRTLLKQWYRNDLMGVPGDEDGGGMSAFVVFSAMGFYPVTPGIPAYNIGSPLFSRIKVDVGEGKYFEIEAVNCSEDNKYIQSATLDGKEWNKPWFTHDIAKNGGKLVLVMGNKANKSWGLGGVPPSAEQSSN